MTAATFDRSVPERTTRTLVWTEYLFLLGVAVATLVTVDPLRMNLEADTIIKHLGLAISIPAIALNLIGHRLFAPSGPRHPIMAPIQAVWPLFLLAGLIVVGALYARLFMHLQDTFLNVGLYMLITFATATVVLQTEAPERFLRAYFGIAVAAALVMGLALIANYGKRQVYHEQIFLIVPMAVLFFLGMRGRPLSRWGGTLFFLGMGWMSQKFTSYMVTGLTLLYLGIVLWSWSRSRYSALHRVTAAYWATLLIALVPVAWIVVAHHGGVDVPTGNTGYRLHTYAAAWDRFVDSPLWGTLFMAQSVHKFTLYNIGISGNRLPTHSDVLDLLANGGIIAVMLLIAGWYCIGRLARRMLFGPEAEGHAWYAYGHTLAATSICAVLVYTFNPILLQPSMAYLVWANLGVLLGLALRFSQPGGKIKK